MHLRGLLLKNHLHRVFPFPLDDDLHRGSSRWHMDRGCDSVSSIIIVILHIADMFLIFILIVIFVFVILTHAAESILIGHLHVQLVMRLDHPLQVGLLLLQLLGSIFLLVAQGL
jgi:hypothetical protein